MCAVYVRIPFCGFPGTRTLALHDTHKREGKSTLAARRWQQKESAREHNGPTRTRTQLTFDAQETPYETNGQEADTAKKGPEQTQAPAEHARKLLYNARARSLARSCAGSARARAGIRSVQPYR